MKYRFGFDVLGLVLFLIVMIPTCVWIGFPAPDDVLRMESVTPVLDVIASVFQVLSVACLCFVINERRSKLSLSPLLFLTITCILTYYLGWVLYYCGIVSPWIILLLTVPPCLGLILFAADRKNLPAVLFAAGFAVCHLMYAYGNFIMWNSRPRSLFL